jgi:hypothetical protein
MCFRSGACLINKYLGLDYTKPKAWLYFRLWDAAVDWALSEGFTSIHSGQTTYPAKIEMGHELIPLVNYVWHRNPLFHAIYGRIAGGLDWAKLDEGLASYLKAHPAEAAAALPASGRLRTARPSLTARFSRIFAPARIWRQAAQSGEAPPPPFPS